MRGSRDELDGLTRLHRISDADERRGVFRQAIATLASATADLKPVPLEGLDPSALRDSTRAALAAGLVDDLAWLAQDHAAGALYELAAALPSGDEKRDLGRRVLQALHTGRASTFVLVATQLALGSRRGLSGPAIRARVALALDLPIGSGIRADPLALALCSRADLADEWLVTPSTGSLPSRRLAARLLERAAREAARRARTGDESALAVFDRAAVSGAWQLLLADREPLVWRHVATARGLLAHAVHRFDVEIDEGLDASLTPTEWRRAAASLSSTMAIDPDRATRRMAALLGGQVVVHDRGVVAAMILGLARAAEAEPDATEEMLVTLIRSGGLDAIEALLTLRQERVGTEFGEWAAKLALARLREDEIARTSGDDGKGALLLALGKELRPRAERVGETLTLREQLRDAQAAFVEQDARTAHAKAAEVQSVVDQTLRRLENAAEDTFEGRMEAFLALRELDLGLLESSTLADLMALGDAGGRRQQAARAADDVFARLTAWIIARERSPVETGTPIEHLTARITQLRTLLHVVDADGAYSDERTSELRERRLQTARFLLTRARDDAPSPLRRIVAAAAARACDALLREDVCELSDAFIAIITHLTAEHDLVTIAEATMVPEMGRIVQAYASLVERTDRAARVTTTRARSGLDALRVLSRELPAASSPRVEALRAALLDFGAAVEAIAEATSIAELAGEIEGATGSLLVRLGDAAHALALLVAGARRRFGTEVEDEPPSCGPAMRFLDVAALHALRGSEETWPEAAGSAIEALRGDLPTPFAEVAANTLAVAAGLPTTAPPRPRTKNNRARDAALPAWLPPSRTLGGFFVLRALGAGAVGSVFVARRAEEKSNERAQSFALKVPEYAGGAARTLSEEQFLGMFREEAGALLSVPSHENLAKLVTFDAGARPKPILVMELVDGPTLERIVETGAMDMQRASTALLGMASGLQIMHERGVGHLDVKPSNVILRDPDGPGPALETPVLVDFGLAGRKVRPGCATASYGAPEVWGLLPKGAQARPGPVDVYAFGCVAFEVLTGRTLFDGASDLAIVTSHLQHDGDIPELDVLSGDSALAPFSELIRGCIRQDPRKRLTIEEVRVSFAQMAPNFAEMRWPLGS